MRGVRGARIDVEKLEEVMQRIKHELERMRCPQGGCWMFKPRSMVLVPPSEEEPKARKAGAPRVLQALDAHSPEKRLPLS